MKKFFRLFGEALRGHDRDYTTLSINTAIFLLAVPMIIEMLGESLFAIVDAFFVARAIGVNAAATVSLTESVMMLIYSVAIGLSAAATAIVARRVGEGNDEAAGEAVSQVLMLSLVVAIVIGALGFVFAEDILILMGAKADVVQTGTIFTKVMFLSSPAIMLLWTVGGVLRGAGDASTAMKSLLIANAINIALDYWLVMHLGVGIVGAAIATTIGRSIGVAYQLRALFYGNGKIKMSMTMFRPKPAIINSILEIAAGGTGQFLISSASWIFLTRILAEFGSEVLAGYNIALRIIIFTILPAWGLANAAATLVGQNLGAEKPDQAEKSVWRIGLYNTIFLLLVSCFFYLFAENIIGLFIQNTVVIKTGVLCLRIFCLGYLFFGYGMVIGQSLNGAGDTKSPTIVNFICFWLIEIPLAYTLAKTLKWGPEGVFWSIAISESILAIIFIFVFRRGKWKLKQV
jgi:putative MATE family efflux protein